jgi:hypothetical protein
MPASLSAWCGDRKGRWASSGSSGLSLPALLQRPGLPLPRPAARQDCEARLAHRDQAGDDDDELSESELAILDALGDSKLSTKQLAKTAGRKCNSYLYRLMDHLKKLGLIVREVGGTYHAG